MMLSIIKSLSAKAVFGLFPANREQDDLQLYTDESRTEPLNEIASAAPAK